MTSINAPSSIVIVGLRDNFEKILEKLDKEGLFLNVYSVFQSLLIKDTKHECSSYFESLDNHQQLLNTMLKSTESG